MFTLSTKPCSFYDKARKIKIYFLSKNNTSVAVNAALKCIKLNLTIFRQLLRMYTKGLLNFHFKMHIQIIVHDCYTIRIKRRTTNCFSVLQIIFMFSRIRYTKPIHS